jgi:hypothetical protein
MFSDLFNDRLCFTDAADGVVRAPILVDLSPREYKNRGMVGYRRADRKYVERVFNARAAKNGS